MSYVAWTSPSIAAAIVVFQALEEQFIKQSALVEVKFSVENACDELLGSWPEISYRVVFPHQSPLYAAFPQGFETKVLCIDPNVILNYGRDLCTRILTEIAGLAYEGNPGLMRLARHTGDPVTYAPDNQTIRETQIVSDDSDWIYLRTRVEQILQFRSSYGSQTSYLNISRGNDAAVIAMTAGEVSIKETEYTSHRSRKGLALIAKTVVRLMNNGAC